MKKLIDIFLAWRTAFILVAILSVWNMDWSMLIAEWIIVFILLDDIYGLTQMRRGGKRMVRRHWKKFTRESVRYFKSCKKLTE